VLAACYQIPYHVSHTKRFDSVALFLSIRVMLLENASARPKFPLGAKKMLSLAKML